MSLRFIRRALPLLLILALALSAVPMAFAAPKGSPVIDGQPTDQTVQTGGKCNFTVKESGATGITWRFIHPVTGETVLASQANKRFKGLQVSGQNSDKLRLSNIPGELDGWQVYCTLANSKGKVETERATLTVTDKQGNPVNGVPETPAPESAGAALTAVGATAVLTESGAYRVTADSPAAYWVINGARYDFAGAPQGMTVNDPLPGTVVEAVPQGGAAKTLGAAPESGEAAEKWVSAVNADLCFVKGTGSLPGGYFTQFNFTDNYQDGEGVLRPGGAVSLCVTARANGGQVAGWRIGNAGYTFDTEVPSFTVTDLSASTVYEATVVGAAAASGGVVRFYPVNCQGCVFTGGGYVNAESGYVALGARITLTPVNAGSQWTVNGENRGAGISLSVTVDGSLTAQCN